MTLTQQELIEKFSPEFECKIYGTEQLKSFFALASFLTETLDIHVVQEPNGEALIFRTMDNSHVALIDVMWNSVNFEKWNIKKAGIFCINTIQVNRLVKHFARLDTITMSIRDGMLIFETKTSTEKIKLLSPTEIKEDVPLPKITYNVRLGTTHKAISDIVKRIALVTDDMDVNMHGQIVEFSGKGDKGESNLKLEKGMPDVPEWEIREDSHSTFSVEYIQAFLKSIIDSSVITEFSTKMPLRMTGFLGTESRVNFYLAPRVLSS